MGFAASQCNRRRANLLRGRSSGREEFRRLLQKIACSQCRAAELLHAAVGGRRLHRSRHAALRVAPAAADACVRLIQLLYGMRIIMRGGILAVGSLFWSDHSSRTKWRSSRLSMESEVSVRVPIRYGRSSKSGSYTMVYSLLCVRKSHGLGIGKAIPFTNEVEGYWDLITEAEYLWAAECNKEAPNGSISTKWGCVALLVNPNSNIENQVVKNWMRKVASEKSYPHISHTKTEPKVVSTTGFLNIEWPITVGDRSLELDFLLATANDPSLDPVTGTYPRIREIVSAWNKNPQERASYFWNNRKTGIHTYQDELILRYLKVGRGQA